MFFISLYHFQFIQYYKKGRQFFLFQLTHQISYFSRILGKFFLLSTIFNIIAMCDTKLCPFLINSLLILFQQLIQKTMIGPHYQRLAEAQRQITGKQMLERVQSHTDNPMTMIIDKLKKQFAEYQNVYTEDITNHQISSVDRLLSFDGKLGPILATIQKQNNLLRRQLSLFQSQLSNSVSICTQLITENGELKEALMQKNADISKIIETIARNQSQGRNELQDKIALLQQQNSILIHHLEEIKRKHEEYQASFLGKQEENKKWERKWNETKKHLGEAIDRQREITRKLAISQHSLFEQKQKLQILQNKLTNCLLEKEDLQRQVIIFEGTRQNFDPQALRRTMENEYMQIIEQHRLFKNERQNILREGQKNKLQKQKLEDTLNDIQKKFNKVLNEYELTNKLLVQEKNRNQLLIGQLKRLQIKIDEIKHQNVQLKMQIQSTKSMLFNKQKSSNSEIAELRKEFDERSSNSGRILREMQIKSQQLLDAKDVDIKRLQEEINEYRRLLGK